MSKYLQKLAAALTEALGGVPSAQPAQVAGYWANRDFWLAEFEHLAAVCRAYEVRVDRMAKAFEDYAKGHGGTHNQDEFGEDYQSVRYTTTRGERKNMVGEARAALKSLAERALDLCIIDSAEFDEFLGRLRDIRID